MNENTNSKAPRPHWRFDDPRVMDDCPYYSLSKYQLEGEFSLVDKELMRILEIIGISVSQVEDLILRTSAAANGDNLQVMERKAFIYRLRELGAYEDDLYKHFNAYMTHDIELMLKDIQQEKDAHTTDDKSDA